MSMIYKGKVYRNIQEQVKKNMEDIEELKNSGEVGVIECSKAYEITSKYITEEELDLLINKFSIIKYNHINYYRTGISIYQNRYILYYEGRALNQHETPNMLFDLNWNPIPHAVLRPILHEIPKPESLNEMILCAKKLSFGFDFVRVDFYEIGKKPIFGEMTFTPDIMFNIYSSFTDLMQIHRQ